MRMRETRERIASSIIKKKLENFNYHISAIFKIDNEEYYFTIVLNKNGEGHINIADEDAHKPLFHIGTFDGEKFTEAMKTAKPIFKEIRKFFRLMGGEIGKWVFMIFINQEKY